MSILSDNIKKRRWELDMTQDELAKKVGYKGRASINKIENGESDVPNSKIELFSKALDISVSWLMGLEKENVAIGEEGYLEVLASRLRENEFAVEIFGTVAEAVDYIAGRCVGKSVGLGDTIVYTQLGLADRLKKVNCEDFYATEVRGNKESGKKAMISDIFILAANGVSYESGEMVNISFRGSRIAGSLYYSDEVIFVVGKNAIAKDLASAINRVKNVYIPKSSKANGLRTPCSKTGKCEGECKCTDRACRTTCIYHNPPKTVDTTVVLINEDLEW